MQDKRLLYFDPLPSEEGQQQSHGSPQEARPGWYQRLDALGCKLPGDVNGVDRARDDVRVFGMTVLAIVDGRPQEAAIIGIWRDTFHLRLLNGIRVLSSKHIIDVVQSPFPFQKEDWTWADIIAVWHDDIIADVHGDPQILFAAPPRARLYTLHAMPKASGWEEPETVQDFNSNGIITLANSTQHYVRRLTIVHAIPPFEPQTRSSQNTMHSSPPVATTHTP